MKNELLVNKIGKNEWVINDSKFISKFRRRLDHAEELRDEGRLYDGLAEFDEAYLYWRNFGKFWERTSGALKLLRTIITQAS